MVTFLTSPLLLRCDTCNEYEMVSTSEAVATFLIKFGAHMNILFIIKMKSLPNDVGY
jgi:hypothetical protein